MRRTSSSTEKGRGHRAAQVTVVTAVAVALVATAAAATGSRSPAPAADRRPPASAPALDVERPVTATAPDGRTMTARFAPRTMDQGAAPDISKALVEETGEQGATGVKPVAVTVTARQSGPVFTPLGTTGLSVSTAAGAWSPDGSRFAYPNAGNVFTIRADRTSPFIISRNFPTNAITWTPKGFSVVLSGRSGRTTGTNIALTSPLGAGEEQITRFPSDQPTTGVAWLADGVSVVSYGSFRATPDQSPSKSRLRRVVRNGAKVTVTDLVPGHPSASLSTTDLYDPVASPALDRVAYRQREVDATAPDGYRDSIWVMSPTGTGTRRIGTGENLTKPVWSADGRTVYVLDARAGTRPLVAYPVGGGDPTTVIANVTTPGNLYRRPLPAGPIRVVRASGRDNVASAIAGSRAAWTVPSSRRASCAKGGAQAAVVIRASSHLEAGPANALAIHHCGPLLVTGSARLDARVTSELRRIVPAGRTVHLVGSTTVLSRAVETSLRALRYRTVRYAGADPYATSVEVATKGWKDHRTAVLASSYKYTEGLIGSVPAGFFGPLLLTDGERMPAVVAAYVRKHRVGAWAVGSAAHKAAPWATRLSGYDPAETSVVVARNFADSLDMAVLVDATAWQDGITAGASAGRWGTPLLATDPFTLSSKVKVLLDAGSGSLQAALLYGRPTMPNARVVRSLVVVGGGRFAS